MAQAELARQDIREIAGGFALLAHNELATIRRDACIALEAVRQEGRYIAGTMGAQLSREIDSVKQQLIAAGHAMMTDLRKTVHDEMALLRADAIIQAEVTRQLGSAELEITRQWAGTTFEPVKKAIIFAAVCVGFAAVCVGIKNIVDVASNFYVINAAHTAQDYVTDAAYTTQDYITNSTYAAAGNAINTIGIAYTAVTSIPAAIASIPTAIPSVPVVLGCVGIFKLSKLHNATLLKLRQDVNDAEIKLEAAKKESAESYSRVHKEYNDAYDEKDKAEREKRSIQGEVLRAKTAQTYAQGQDTQSCYEKYKLANEKLEDAYTKCNSANEKMYEAQKNTSRKTESATYKQLESAGINLRNAKALLDEHPSFLSFVKNKIRNQIYD